MNPEQSDADFVEEYRPLVASIAQKIRARFELRAEMDDLMAYGFAGLLEARRRYDPTRGVQFNSFAYYRIRGAIIDGVRDGGFLSRRAYKQLKAAEAALYVGESIGEARAADPKARADKEKTAETLRDAITKLSASWTMAALGQSEEEQTKDDPEEALLSQEMKERVRKIVPTLPERERLLVEGFYFQGRRFDHVAEELGISKSWASRLHHKALGRIRDALAEE
ncbi:MAG: sigma-70 family RNA polymerase sigma factor [Deltaproteobacteria bacterium]|nr:sigma-70 family RNA polymerase sigma factor [Deltaproteobacteria bacterium]